MSESDKLGPKSAEGNAQAAARTPRKGDRPEADGFRNSPVLETASGLYEVVGPVGAATVSETFESPVPWRQPEHFPRRNDMRSPSCLQSGSGEGAMLG